MSVVTNLFEYFEARGYTMDAAPDGVTGLHVAKTQEFDVVVLDWMLPRMDGPEVFRRLREEGYDTPVIMLTAKDELLHKISGFRSGADDYVTKPFHLPELEVRIEALVARAKGRGRSNLLRVADLTYDVSKLEAERGGRILSLYPASRKLLEVLMRASPATVPRERLEYELWGDEPPDGNMLRSHIYDLRQSVDAPFPTKLIQTVSRVGYRIAEHDGIGRASNVRRSASTLVMRT